MAGKHISVPKAFAAGDADEWFKRFEICCRANEWNDATKALKLPTLLEGEALAVWLELSAEQQGDYATAKKEMVKKLSPSQFASLDEFHRRKLRPGESLAVFEHDLKRVLEQAMPELRDKEAREQLLLHQFLAGLPTDVARQLRATGDTTKLDTVAERARLLMALDTQATAAIRTSTSKDSDCHDEVKQLRDQIAELTQQVAALTTTRTRGPQAGARAAPKRCFACNQVGHFQRNCPTRRRFTAGYETRRCFACGRLGHTAKECQQGNDNGTPGTGYRRPRQQ